MTSIINTSRLLLMLLFSFQISYAFSGKGFVENIGQVTDQFGQPRQDIRFSVNNGAGMKIYFSENGLYYQWYKGDQIYRMDVKLVGANPNPRISTEKVQNFKESFTRIIGKDAKSFGKITYHEVYPHIDWVFYFNAQGQLEHDFVVHPGAKVSDIRIQYLGADKMNIEADGGLLVQTPFGAIKENSPYTYEQVSGKPVKSSYRLDGDQLSFSTENYRGTLIIDPVIDWATYVGGADYDEVWDTKVGKDGMVYVTGSTNSITNIATTGAHLTTFAGGTNPFGSDAFLRKYNPQGECLWGTYLGGTNVELGLSLAIDTIGNLYVAGRTNSQTGIATTGVHQELKAGTNASYDAFIVKFDTAGQRLAGTYFGGTGAEGSEMVAITCDRYNNLYLVGNTQSAGGIATANAFQVIRPGNHDGFIVKFNTNLLRIWGTYFGTSSNDYINAVTTDSTGNVIVAGHTQSATGIATTGSGAGGTDGFVAKLDSAGNRLWSVYYGGPGYEKLNALVTDSAGAVYGLGATESTSGLASTGAHQPVNGGSIDLCLFKMDAAGQLLWSTFFGGSSNENPGGLLFVEGNLYFSGQTLSSTGITTPDATVPLYNTSASEAMLITFSPLGQRLWGTYLGGDAEDYGRALAAYDGNLYIAGSTTSVNNLATTGADQNVFGGTNDGMLLHINMCSLPELTGTITGNTTVCEHSEQVFHINPSTSADSYIWVLPNGWIGSSTSDSIVATVGSNSGDILLIPQNACGIGDTLKLAVTVNPAPTPTISRSGNILTVGQIFTTYQWLKNGTEIAGANGPSYAATVNSTYRIRVTGANGCTGLSNEIQISNLSGIKDLLADKGIHVSPNPFVSAIRLELPQKAKLRLLDISGKIVQVKAVNAGTNIITIPDLAEGTYILQVYTVDGAYLGATQLSKTNY